MTTLEERFVATLDDLALPERDLVDDVLAAIGSSPTAQVKVTEHGRRPRVLVGAIAACIALMAMLAITPVRDAVADLLGIGATELEVDPTGDLSGVSESSAEVLGGQRVEPTINPLLGLEEPADAFDDPDVTGRTYVWGATSDRPALGDTDVGLMLSVRTLDGPVATKRLPGDVEFESIILDLDGGSTTGIWIDDTHEFQPAGSSGPVLAENVLLWVSGNLQYRLEANLDLTTMQQLAESVTGGTDLLPPG